MINKRPWLGALSAISLGLCSFSASADFYAGALVSYSNAEFHHSSSSVTEGNPFLLQAQAGYFFNCFLKKRLIDLQKCQYREPLRLRLPY
ncbi:hypothetical protein ABJY87_14640, partial [Vibrio parahaemolyticus]